MATILLIIIYIAFISLGLPDAVIGSAWPVIHQDLEVSIASAGIMTMIISGSTIISSLFSVKLIRSFGTGKVTMVSVAMTGLALMGICFTPNYFWMCFLGIPLGLGAGSVDVALNNFVALHYKAIHMNWLHSFWGVGATAGPLLMSLFLMKERGWRTGYAVIGSIQLVLVVVLIVALPVWRKFDKPSGISSEDKSETRIIDLIKVKGAKPVLMSFFCYCAVETTVGLWGSSFLVISKGISVETAAKWVALYYFGITVGRFLAGFLSLRFNNLLMIRFGQLTCLSGVVLLAVPLSVYFQMAGLILIGLGCAPIFPAMLHETPNRFGSKMSQGIMGIQMATAYVGSTFMPPIIGFLAERAGFGILPGFLFILVLLMLLTSEKVNKIVQLGTCAS